MSALHRTGIVCLKMAKMVNIMLCLNHNLKKCFWGVVGAQAGDFQATT